MTGNLSEQDIIMFAADIFNDYDIVCKNDRNKWREIKSNQFDVNPIWTIRECRRKLNQFVKKYNSLT